MRLCKLASFALTKISSLRSHFQNISLIMDCVQCDKCRLWGKIQVSRISELGNLKLGM